MDPDEEFVYGDDHENDNTECFDDADDEREVDDYADPDNDSDYDSNVNETRSPQKRGYTAINNSGLTSIHCMLGYQEDYGDDDDVDIDVEPVTQVKIASVVKDVPELHSVVYDAEKDHDVFMTIIRRRDARLKKRSATSSLDNIRKKMRFDNCPIQLEDVDNPSTTPHLCRDDQCDDDMELENSVVETITTTSFDADIQSKTSDVELDEEDDLITFSALSSPAPQPRPKTRRESKKKTRKRPRSKSPLSIL